MRKTTVAIDDELARRASAVLETKGLTATVNEALRRVVIQGARERVIHRLETMEGLDLDNPEIMAGAWHE